MVSCRGVLSSFAQKDATLINTPGFKLPGSSSRDVRDVQLESVF